MVKNWIVLWIKKLRKKTKLFVKIIEKVWLVLTIIATLIGLFTGVISLKTSTRSTEKASKYFDLSKKYFLEDKNYDKAIEYGEKAYNLDANITDLRFYYALELLLRQKGNDRKIAREILFENSYYLNNREKAIYGMEECRNNEYAKAYDIFRSIDSFSDIDLYLLPDFIESIMLATFETLDYNESVAKAQKYYFMLEKVFYSTESLFNIAKSDLFFFDWVLEFNDNGIKRMLVNSDVNYIKEAKLILGNSLHFYASKNMDADRSLAGLKIGSKCLDYWYGNKLDPIYKYLYYLSYYKTYQDITAKTRDNLRLIFDETKIRIYSYFKDTISFNTKYKWKGDTIVFDPNNQPVFDPNNPKFEELKYVFNIFIDNNALDWKKFDINLHNNLKLEFLVMFTTPTAIKKITLMGNTLRSDSIIFNGSQDDSIMSFDKCISIIIPKNFYPSKNNYRFHFKVEDYKGNLFSANLLPN